MLFCCYTDHHAVGSNSRSLARVLLTFPDAQKTHSFLMYVLTNRRLWEIVSDGPFARRAGTLQPIAKADSKNSLRNWIPVELVLFALGITNTGFLVVLDVPVMDRRVVLSMYRLLLS